MRNLALATVAAVAFVLAMQGPVFAQRPCVTAHYCASGAQVCNPCLCKENVNKPSCRR